MWKALQLATSAVWIIIFAVIIEKQYEVCQPNKYRQRACI